MDLGAEMHLGKKLIARPDKSNIVTLYNHAFEIKVQRYCIKKTLLTRFSSGILLEYCNNLSDLQIYNVQEKRILLTKFEMHYYLTI